MVRLDREEDAVNMPPGPLLDRRACDQRWPRKHSVAILRLAFCLILVPLVSAPGQTTIPGAVTRSTPGAASPVASSSGITKTTGTKLVEARANLAAAEASGDVAGVNVPAGVSAQDVAIRRALLQRMVRLYEQQLSNAAELETIKTRREGAAREAQAWTRFAEPPPYSILLTDRLREEIQAEQLKTASAQAALSTLDQLMVESRSALDQAEEKIRQLNEQLEAEDNLAVTGRSWQRDLQRLRSQAAAATLGVLDSERQLRQEFLAESRIRIDLLQRQLVLADAGVKFSQADLNQVAVRIESDRQQLERELSDAETRFSSSLQALEAARDEQRLAQARPDGDRSAATAIAEKVATRQAQFETAQAAIRILRFMLESEDVERTMWEMRFAAYGSRDVKTLNESQHRLEAYTQRLNLWKDFQQQQMETFPSQIELQETRIGMLPPDSDLLPLARERLATLRERDQLLLRLLRRMEQTRSLSERWAGEIQAAEERLPLLGRVQNLFSGAGSFLQKLWMFELFTAEDTITVEGQTITGKRSITLGKVIMAVLILGVGIWITGLISRVAEPIFIRRFKIELNQAHLIRRWLRALMVAGLVIFSLVSVKIPLTVFAFAGGALAIGLGFGMQTVLKNFVSGLIILFERPFRVGDVLDIGGQQGTITGVGLRASVLLLWDGTETLIPNSVLLENKLTNWTYSDRKVRFAVTVGVAYDSDPRRVAEVLSESAERHGRVEKEPKPQVLLTEFGDSALIFELRFWVDVSRLNPAQISSDLRLMIAGSLADRGIVIAFPQRDLHLHATGPIPANVVSAPSAATPGRKSDAAEAGTSQSDKGTQELLEAQSS